MQLLESKDFREFIALLNLKKVRFLIVGGHAVGFHGFPRFTGDLDVFISIAPASAELIAEALKDFGFGAFFKPDDFLQPGYAIQLGREPYRIDILTSIAQVQFESAYQRRRTIRIGGLNLSFIGLEDLLVNKRAVGRPKDLEDVAKLSSIAQARDKSRNPRAAKTPRQRAGKHPKR